MTNSTTIKRLLGEEIESQTEMMSKQQLGTDESEITISGTTKLIDRYIDLEKMELERLKVENEERKLELERQKAKEEAFDRKINNWLKGGTLFITGTGIVLMFVLEGEGRVITSQAGRKIVDRIFKISN